MDIRYFGTALDDKGHYLWNHCGDRLCNKSLDLKELPFCPESFPKKGETKSKGECKIYHEAGYTILAYEGSTIDDRWGTRSVFFAKGTYTPADMLFNVKNIPVYKQIITRLLSKYNKIKY